MRLSGGWLLWNAMRLAAWLGFAILAGVFVLLVWFIFEAGFAWIAIVGIAALLLLLLLPLKKLWGVRRRSDGPRPSGRPSGEDGSMQLKTANTWPLTPWAVAMWLVAVVSLGIATAFLVAFPLGWPDWLAIALGGAFTLVYRQLFWTVLRRVQRRAGR